MNESVEFPTVKSYRSIGFFEIRVPCFQPVRIFASRKSKNFRENKKRKKVVPEWYVGTSARQPRNSFDRIIILRAFTYIHTEGKKNNL